MRLGSVYALERIARDSRKDHATVMEVLAAFVRERSREEWLTVEPESEVPYRTTRPDVQAAVTVIGRNGPHSTIDLRRAVLPWANLGGAHLRGAYLDKANLDHANLTGADLRGASVAIQPEWRHAGSVAGFGAWVPVGHASACGWPDLPGSGAWCVRVVVYGGAVAGGSQGWPVNSRVRASSASMPHLPAVDR